LNDVAQCDLFIVILGLRYGHVPGKPFRNPKKLSITELEYRQAGKTGIPRLVFLKNEDAIPYTQTDTKTKEHPPERIEAFRATASADQRPAIFRDVAELREAVLKAFGDFEKRRQGAASPGPQPSREVLSNETIRAGYVNWLREECEKVVLLGLDLRDRQSVRLGQVYTHIGRCRAGRSRFQNPDLYQHPGEIINPPLADDATADYGRQHDHRQIEWPAGRRQTHEPAAVGSFGRDDPRNAIAVDEQIIGG
jgi:hypothetical protein